VIPPRKNAKPWKDTKSSSLERNELLRTVKRLGRTLWKKWSGYHRRSLVETKMNCIKLLGDKLSARSFDSQVNEIHARVAVLNRFTGYIKLHPKIGAYEDYIRKLPLGSRLPRGKYFKGRKAGDNIRVMDEYWSMFNQLRNESLIPNQNDALSN